MTISVSPFGAYTTMTSTTSASNKSEIAANGAKLITLFVGSGSALARSAPHTDFDKIDPALSDQIRAEITAFLAVIAAS